MKNIKIHDLEIPLMQFATQATGVLGTKGSGKSYDSGVLVEQLIASDIPATIIDPSGVWRYMKVPGHGKGFEVVVVGGGDQQDLPLDPHTIEDITKAAMKSGVTIVIDLFTSRPSKETIRQVVLKCVQTMFYENESPRMVVIEEAAEVCPQRVMAEHAKVYSAIDQLVRVGGNRSLGVMLINQRAEDVNKSVLELCDFMFLHRQRGRNSLKNLEDWFHKTNMEEDAIEEVIATTMRLDAGECWFMSKDADHPMRLKFPKKQSFHPDRMKPEITAKAVKNVVDVAAWVEKLKAKLPKPEEKKPVAAKAAMAPAPAPTIEYVDRPVITEAEFSLLANVLDTVRAQKSQIVSFEASILEFRMKIEALMQKQKFNRPAITPRAQASPRVTAPVAKASNGESDSELGTGGPRRMLIALAQRSPLTRQAICTRSQIAPGSFDTYFRRLTSNGWAEKSGDQISITVDGRTELGEYEPLPTGQALLDYYLNYLGDSGPRRMLETLAQFYPDEIEVENLCEHAGIAVGSFDTYMRKLKTLELAEKNGRGVIASAELFE